MYINVSYPGNDLSQEQIDRIQKDLEKIDRRLSKVDEIYLEVRLNDGPSKTTTGVTLRLEYGPNHLTAVADDPDEHKAIRIAREDLLRQINDRTQRSRGDHIR